MNDSSDNEGKNDEDFPKTPYHGENTNASDDYQGNYDEVAPDLPTNDVNINDNSDDEKKIIRLSLIHLQMVEIMKQLKTMKKQL